MPRHIYALAGLMCVLCSVPALAETHWTTNYGPLTLPDAPQGSVNTIWGPWRGRVTGRFTAGPKGPTLNATHVGSFHDIPCANTLNGAWYWGKLSFVFDRGYRSFRGTFNRCGKGEENPVTGKRNN